MATQTAQGLDVGQHPSGLDPHDVGLGLYLCTSVCLISLVPEIQDGGESLLTDRQFSCGFCGVKVTVNLPLLVAWLASEGQW